MTQYHPEGQQPQQWQQPFSGPPQGHPHYPPQPGQQPPQPEHRENHTGYSITAIVLSAVGLVTPGFAMYVIWIMTALAVFFGIAGFRYYRAGQANKPVAIVGLIGGLTLFAGALALTVEKGGL